MLQPNADSRGVAEAARAQRAPKSAGAQRRALRTYGFIVVVCVWDVLGV